MIYPWDIARFRAALDAGLASSTFERYNFSKARLRVGGVRSAQHVTPNVSLELRAPAATFGTPAVPSCLQGVSTTRIDAPAARVETVQDATIIGLNAFVDPDGNLFTPTLCGDAGDRQKALLANKSNAEGYVLQVEEGGGLTACFFSGREQRRIKGTALFLSNIEIGNYGSFLIRVLPQLIQAKNDERDFDFYISADRSPWLPQAIAQIGLPNRPIFLVEEVCGDTFETVIAHSTPCEEGLFDATTMADARRLIASEAATPQRRLYVSRQLSRTFRPHYRQLLNESDVAERFVRAGFAVVFPETLPFLEQVRLFSEANTIAGPSGSGMLNAIFSHAGGKVLDIEGFNVTVRQHAKVYSSSGHPYAFCFGRLEQEDDVEPSSRSWRVDLKVLDQALDWVAN